MRDVVRFCCLLGLFHGWSMATAAPLSCGGTARQLVVQKQAFIAVPFAVPVAQPVAVFQYPQVWYGAGLGMQQARPEQVPEVVPLAEPEATWIRRSCLSCHNVNKAEGGLDLSDLAKLSSEQRLTAIKRVVSDDPAVRMPPSVELEPAALGGLVQELSEIKGEAK